eukprot:m.201659 g.201659  ORF g.201659 m.201659 type:complete len:55 (-) comp15349_c1_seq2:90-254(-)
MLWRNLTMTAWLPKFNWRVRLRFSTSEVADQLALYRHSQGASDWGRSTLEFTSG